MGPKSKTSTTDSKKYANKDEETQIYKKLKSLLKDYETNCEEMKSIVDLGLKDLIKNHMKDTKWLCRFVLQDTTSNEQAWPKKISPLIKAIRMNWYTSIKDLYLWKMTVPREEVSDLIGLFENRTYQVEYLELVQCNIDVYSLKEFSRCFELNQTLTTVVLDYTNLQLDGISALCSGLKYTKSIVKLSICYCNLNFSCGGLLGNLIADSTISEVYLDGNCLECIGLIDILQKIVDRVEHDKLEQERIKTEKENTSLPVNNSAVSMYMSKNSISQSEKKPLDVKKLAVKKKKKKKKKGKKGANVKVLPKCGPYLSILHIVDNGIDSVSVTSKKSFLLQSMLLVRRWISAATELKEFDLDDNLIGELGGREVLAALKQRKTDGLDNIYMKVTHRLSGELFKNILTLASGPSKRGGKKKKKKKGQPGKRKI